MPRPLKVFTIEGCYSHAPHAALKALGAPSHITQATMYVAARTKKDALQYLNNATRGNFKSHEMHEASGNSLDAIRAGGYFFDDNDEGRVAIMWGRGSGGKVVVPSADGWTVVGEVTHQDPENERNFLRKPIFVHAKPAPKPIRLVIELDADTDTGVAAKLIEGVRCRISFGRITAYDVVGKVVES